MCDYVQSFYDFRNGSISATNSVTPPNAHTHNGRSETGASTINHSTPPLERKESEVKYIDVSFATSNNTKRESSQVEEVHYTVVKKR